MIEIPIASTSDWSWMTALLGPFLHPGGEALSRRVVDLCDVRPESTLVDLGCGAGMTLALAKHKEPTVRSIGIDARRVPLAGHHPTSEFIRAVGGQLPLRSERVDAIISECSLCLMRPFDAVLTEIRRSLRLGGHLVFSDFYATEPLRWSSEELAAWACVLEPRTQKAILGAMDRASFQDVAAEDHSDGLWEIERRVQAKVDVLGLIEALAASGGDPVWADAARFLHEAREYRDRGALRYGIFRARRV